MGFWLYCTAMCLLVPAVMLYFGWRFLNRTAQKDQCPLWLPNQPFYENQQTWDYAHQVCGKLWFRAGIVMLPLSLLAMLPCTGQRYASAGNMAYGCGFGPGCGDDRHHFPSRKGIKTKI